MVNLNQDVMNERLIEGWIDNHGNLSDNEKEIFRQLRRDVKNDVDIYYKINNAIVREDNYIEDEKYNIQLGLVNGISTLVTQYGNIEMQPGDLRRVIAAHIDIYEPMYPIGTIVELKKNLFKHYEGMEDKESIKGIITHRFMPHSEHNYMNYVAMPYPYGIRGMDGKAYQFTTKGVERVIHMGYADEQEISYLFYVKNKLIVENNMHSGAFMTNEEYLTEITSPSNN